MTTLRSLKALEHVGFAKETYIRNFGKKSFRDGELMVSFQIRAYDVVILNSEKKVETVSWIRRD